MTIRKSLNLTVAGLFAVLIALFFVTTSVSADDGEDHSEEATTTETTEATETMEEKLVTEATTEVFEFTAQPGDSYSLMARKAVQINGFETSTSLTQAQIIYVETNLTKLASSPKLNLGEKISISKELVKQWSEKAKELTDAQQANWQVFANNANFNTDTVGESRN